MGRWEPNARERLERSALELFLQQGYESTTAAEIAERAGLAKSTFFRHFTDKREVLFGGQEALNRLFADAITGAPGSATPLDAIRAALESAVRIFSPERHVWVRQRKVVITGNSDLLERELLKLASLTAAMADALRKRGVTDPTASLAAELGRLAFHNAYARWADPANQRDYLEIAHQELDELRAATAALGQEPPAG
ncbi:DNA-binding transcriptional regulator, AcrR family [Nonomuraea solani]|uniref:DNA-binding transcriptional regulator, AcrR family n=1 Tax=Nonomuraea solani TaxID=1144553 RepID=A0A1H6EUK3_9ACTN|nr:TetR/AcrR family transcriptional regulator [Nonomuraea solani]SEH00384.1 DNA-binding transcriptional regulator, AcrR family [Nonomuraea solani]